MGETLHSSGDNRYCIQKGTKHSTLVATTGTAFKNIKHSTLVATTGTAFKKGKHSTLVATTGTAFKKGKHSTLVATTGEYEFKRINPHGLITAKHRLHQPTGKTPPLYGRKPCRIPNVEWHLPWLCLEEYMGRSQHNSRHTINTSYNQYVIPSQYHQDTTAQ